MESMAAHAWSAGEVAVAAARVHEVWSDPHRDALLDDIAQRGFYVPIDPADVDLRIDDQGHISGNNPYRRVAPHPPERVVARLVTRGDRPSRRLVVVCHCYGIPVPAVMERLFGLR